jgi:hypothetical protein
MDKKYQIFISSTYLDMKDERQVAVESILDAGHIPAGMELFAASDKKQIEVIQGWIDKSDIFMLILGGRYGSVEPESGKSYIQFEYEYAVEMKKPLFALYLTDGFIQKKAQGPLGLAATEQDDTKKLREFRSVVKGRLCSEVDDLKDIRIQVPKAIRERAADGKLEGWVRASSVPDMSPLMAQLARFQGENEALKKELELRIADQREAVPSVLPRQWRGTFSPDEFARIVKLNIRADSMSLSAFDTRQTWSSTYSGLFKALGPILFNEPVDDAVHESLNRTILDAIMQPWDTVRVLDGDFRALKMKFAALGLVDFKKDGAVRWVLTETGKQLLMDLHANDD